MDQRTRLRLQPAPRPRGGQSILPNVIYRPGHRSPPTRGSVGDLAPYEAAQAPLPRPRGGQSLHVRGDHRGPARSPPTRGSVAVRAINGRDRVPLPAHAGSVVCRLTLGSSGCRSPPTRGSVVVVAGPDADVAPLPAHAGVSRRRCGRVRRTRSAPRPRGGQSGHPPAAAGSVAAPRPRGGQSFDRCGCSDPQRRSPPTRGSVDRATLPTLPATPLPAHAGVSRRRCPAGIVCVTAPRPRGGQSPWVWPASASSGRSPPTRGSVETAAVEATTPRPLPAHAGVSRSRFVARCCRTPAPRPRGGQSVGVFDRRVPCARSPPTRGSVDCCACGVSHSSPAPRPTRGSVENSSGRGDNTATAPRPRGGQSDVSVVSVGGPTPLPAHAGVSRRIEQLQLEMDAAPRPRGGSVGTTTSLPHPIHPLPAHAGVSRYTKPWPLAALTAPRPRRGSVDHLCANRRCVNPLPAHAGVSRRRSRHPRLPRSAPRPRGGQSSSRSRPSRRYDRSPPTRGSVDDALKPRPHPVPLPAHAGVSRWITTYSPPSCSAPRPRGGQSQHPSRSGRSPFRSPPTRGSVADRVRRCERQRPLPAHAGVSRSSLTTPRWPRSAPRPRGGQSA